MMNCDPLGIDKLLRTERWNVKGIYVYIFFFNLSGKRLWKMCRRRGLDALFLRSHPFLHRHRLCFGLSRREIFGHSPMEGPLRSLHRVRGRDHKTTPGTRRLWRFLSRSHRRTFTRLATKPRRFRVRKTNIVPMQRNYITV